MTLREDHPDRRHHYPGHHHRRDHLHRRDRRHHPGHHHRRDHRHHPVHHHRRDRRQPLVQILPEPPTRHPVYSPAVSLPLHFINPHEIITHLCITETSSIPR